MRIFSAAGPVSRTKARNCLLVNQLATPGLGSLMAGRVGAGLIQLGLAVVGFLFVTGWFLQLFLNSYREFSDQPPAAHSYPWLGKAGFLLFAGSWALSWFTSLSLLREARRNEPEPPPQPAVPPKIT